MRFSHLVLVPIALSSAFVPSSVRPSKYSSNAAPSLYASSPQDNSDSEANAIDTFWHSVDPLKQHLATGVATAFLSASLWASPAALMGMPVVSNNVNIDNASPWVSVANAKEMASGSGSRVNKDPESLLRLGLPIKNKEVRALAIVIEEIRTDVSSKRKGPAIDANKKAREIMKKKATKMTASCRDAKVCADLLIKMDEQASPIDAALKESQDAFQGSDQERKALDDAYKAQDEVQKSLTVLEELMVPTGFKTPVPDIYSDLPQLEGGRATIEMVIKKAGNEQFRVEGILYPEAKLKMIVDGFTAPVTGGNFVDLVDKGFYTKMKIQRSDGFVVQTGDPDGPADGYVGKGSKSIGQGPHGERLIPSEIFVSGDKGPFYETTIEDEGRGGQSTVLPFSSFGAMGWAREEYEPNSGSSQFFWLLFDSDLTPAGKNVLDGRYPCFAYVVEGADFLGDTKEDDIIMSAKVTSGIEFLKGRTKVEAPSEVTTAPAE